MTALDMQAAVLHLVASIGYIVVGIGVLLGFVLILLLTIRDVERHL